MSEEVSAIVSQMKSWETTEIENSFLSSCVYFLENQQGSPSELCDLASTVDQEWFAEPHKKAIFHIIKKVVLDSSRSSVVVPGSIAVMAEKLLFSMGYKEECPYVEDIVSYPSSFFSIESLELAIPLWKVKLARNRLKANAERMINLLAESPSQKVFEEDIPALIESQQDIWHGASLVDKKDDSWEASIKEMLSPLPTDISVSTGLRVLDDAIQGGISKRNSPYSGRLIVVAARPAMGKSAMAVFLATQLAGYYGDIAFFSLEMSKVQIQNRSLACFDYLNLMYQKQLVDPLRINDLRLRTYTAAQRARLEGYIDSPLAKRFHIFDASSVSVSAISAKIALLAKTRKNLTAIFIDYLQLIEGCSGDGQNTESSNIGNVTRALKQLAMAFGIDIVLLCQINRGVETRSDKMPNLSDLRASGRIEEDADIVMFLLRPSYYDYDKDPYELAISVAKNRHGGCGTLGCSIDLQSSVIFDKH